jgi:hypothetical protein
LCLPGHISIRIALNCNDVTLMRVRDKRAHPALKSPPLSSEADAQNWMSGLKQNVDPRCSETCHTRTACYGKSTCVPVRGRW